MSTVILSPSDRPINAESFTAFVGDVAVSVAVEEAQFRVTFDADLDAETVAAIRGFMSSRDDTDQTARANLATLRTAATTGDIETVRALAIATADYLLGEA